MEPFSTVVCIQLFTDPVFKVVHTGIYNEWFLISADCLFLGKTMNTEPYLLPAYLCRNVTVHLSIRQVMGTWIVSSWGCFTWCCSDICMQVWFACVFFFEKIKMYYYYYLFVCVCVCTCIHANLPHAMYEGQRRLFLFFYNRLQGLNPSSQAIPPNEPSY